MCIDNLRNVKIAKSKRIARIYLCHNLIVIELLIKNILVWHDEKFYIVYERVTQL